VAAPRRRLDHLTQVGEDEDSVPFLRSAADTMIHSMTSTPIGSPRGQIFVSYTSADRVWAEWISWQLVRDGWRVDVQAWDSVPGTNFVGWIDACLARADYVLLVVSQAYLTTSPWGALEWQAAYQPGQRRILPVRVEDVEAGPLVRVLGRIDVFGIPEDVARQRLLDGVRSAQAGGTVPTIPPPFPGP
jgi:hypothetical protein